jgi:hypothetical protein
MFARLSVIPLLALAVTIAANRSGRTEPAPLVGPAAFAGALAPTAGQLSLEGLDRALVARDIRAAEIAWRNAYGEAIRSRRWDALLAVGEGSLRMGDQAVARELRMGDQAVARERFRSRAREAWLRALFLARDRRSVHGVLTVADAFARLGDTDTVAQALTIADALATLAPDGNAPRDALALRTRLFLGAMQGASR